MMYKTVPVTEDNLPPVHKILKHKNCTAFYPVILKDGSNDIALYNYDLKAWVNRAYYQLNNDEVTHYLLPVGEEKLRRLSEACYNAGLDRGWRNKEMGGGSWTPELSAAITSLIQKFLKDEL